MPEYIIVTEGDRNDYADCYHTICAPSMREAIRKWEKLDGRPIVRIWRAR